MYKRSVLKSCLLGVALLACVHVGDAQSQPEVHNTGVDGSDDLVAAGQAAAFWTLSAKPAASGLALGSSPFRYYVGAYFADTASAAWVSPASNGIAGAAGNYVYDLEVDLTGFNPDTVSVSGFFGTDNDGEIWVNDEAPVATTGFGAFGAHTAFTIDSGWVAGSNTIHVRVNNGGDPTSFFVQFDSTSGGGNPPPSQPSIPVPTLAAWSTILLVLVIAGLALVYLRRRKGSAW